MSIYGTRVQIGIPQLRDEEFLPGVVGEYVGSHVYSPGGTMASISTAQVPAWCVPGHEDIEDQLDENKQYPVGEWLRLSVDGPDNGFDVLIDEDAARSLRDELTAWLGLPKVKAVTA